MDLINIKNNLQKNDKKFEEKNDEFAFVDNIKQSIEKIEQNEEKKIIKEEKAKIIPRIIQIEAEYEFNDGSVKKCKLSSKVMDNEARLKYDRVLATLSSGLIFDNLPTEIQNRYAAIARIMAQCIDAPDWIFEVCGEDIEFAYNLTLQLLEHEKRFFRHNPSSSEGGEAKKRFSLHTTAFKD
jgi:hypothetical protein